MAKRTEQYYKAVADYRKRLREIWESYNHKAARLKYYEGSAGFKKDMEKLETERANEISKLQTDYKSTFNTILREMRESAKSRTMTPPTQEQLAILQALRMRDNISRDELEQAGNNMRGCPVALGVLEELATKQAEKNGGLRYGLRFETESTSGILKCIDSLEDSARRICALNKCDSRREMAMHSNDGRYDPDGKGIDSLFSFRIDKDVSGTAEAMSFFGGVRNLDSFENAVNG